MLDRLFKKNKAKILLIELIEHNAAHIRSEEVKNEYEAIYLSLCLILDDLKARPNGQKGYQNVMEIIQSHYPDHFNDVMTYLTWASGKVTFKPEHDAKMKMRHQKGRS